MTAADYTDRNTWPATLGLFGTYAGLLNWCSSMWPASRASGGSRGVFELPRSTSSDGAFGAAAAESLEDVTNRLLLDPEARGLSLEPVRAAWKKTAKHLASQLVHLPTEVDGEILAEAIRWSLRRFTGLVSLVVVELLLCGVLGLFVWRVGRGYISAEYAGSQLLLSALVLLVALILAGHLVANIFFPSLRERFRVRLTARADRAVDTAWEAAQTALREHVQAIGHLANRGSESLRMIDQIVQSLARSATDDADVQRLFGEGSATSPAASLKVDAVRAEPDRQRVPKLE
jgi:hypothetical protein